ncbi:hypothetical protein L9F63_018400 [Diploptera punctata]|uniref:Chromo domain-containing protein n=1 Tax=Diploptera punctata TaxID=6984 RepID=A0AAD8EFJ1_DIPPU|nr:hypothetical protein L9F63_018400 [Diploptera punctata]
MEGEAGDPSSVRKNPRMIKAAQEEIATLDVLVCGTCHYVFHYIEAFQEHKNANECGKPTFKANLSESKPQVWAFLLWKSSVMNQHKAEGEKEPINSWKLYQRWCKMASNTRESWIAAGKSIQAFSTLANAKLAEVHSKNPADVNVAKPRITITKPVPLSDDEEDLKSEEAGDNDGEIKSKRVIQRIVHIPVEKVEKKDPSDSKSDENESVSVAPTNEETGDPDKSEAETEVKNDEKDSPADNEDTNATKEENKLESNDPLTESTVEIKVENMSSEEDQTEPQPEKKEVVVKPPQRPGTVKRKPLPDSKLGNRVIRKSDKSKDGEESSEDEYVVEKILAKRFNPKRKYYEYLLKWEGYPHDQNTWEPVENMAACDKLVETFERNLARQKAMQQKQAAQLAQQKLNQGFIQKSMIKVVKTTTKPEELSQPGPSGLTSFESRPVRSSKKRALEQVKSWCGSMTKKEFEAGKRKPGEESDSDEEMGPEKKIKLEPPDDDWSGGEIGTSMNSGGSSDDDSGEKKRTKQLITVPGNQKVISIIQKSVNKSPMLQMGDDAKRGPGRPPRRIQSIDSPNTINGITKSKSGTEKDLAVELGLASDSSPEHKSKSQTISKQSSSSQPPVLVANSKGVIKVDPRQVPNLTSGVYIVSNKSGIVKLNDVPSSIKGKISPTKPSVQGQKIGSAGVVLAGNKIEGIQSGIVRKPLSQSPSGSRGQLGHMSIKQGITPRTPLTVNSGLVRVTPPGSLNKPQLGSRPSLGTPRVLGPRSSLSSPRPSLSMLTQRPGLMQSSLRPGLQPRLSGMSLRPSLSSPGLKKSPGLLGGPPRLASTLRPKTALQSPMGRGIIRNPSPAAQVKSGVKPIHAMLGKAVQNYGLSGMTPQQRLLMAKKQQAKEPTVLMKQGSGTVIVPAASVQLKPSLKPEDVKMKKPIGRGRGRGINVGDNVNNVGKLRDSKLVDGDGLHMEFHEVHSSSDSDDGFDSMPELPMGDLPSLEPDSPPRPFTLCPETGKILSRAEGEPSPPPTPEPQPEPEPNPEEGEEILPDKREASPIRVVQESTYPNTEETLLKVEMSPGGTTGTVIESNVADPTAYMNTLRTEEGLTVTKISTANTSTNDTQVVVPTSKIGGGISVPARKLFLDSSSNNSDGANSGETSVVGSEINTELVTITGEDGVVYQIATEEEQEGGEAMLVSADGEQQCVYVTAEQAAGMEDGSVLTLDSAVAEAVAQLMPDQVNVIGGGSGCSQFYVKEEEGDSGQLMITSGVEQGEETTQAQVVAQVVQEGESPSGSSGMRRVVLLLPDGNLMMTEVDEEQYAALELDK